MRFPVVRSSNASDTAEVEKPPLEAQNLHERLHLELDTIELMVESALTGPEKS